MAIRYWLGVVQRDHALRGVALGIAQVNHGTRAPLERMRPSDGFVYYSPRVTFPDGEPLRAFTAVGRVAEGEVYQATQGPAMRGPAGDFRPWRRRVDYDADTVEAPIRPLLNALDLTRGNTNWGYQLRRGLLEISRHDFDLVRAQMRREP
ncbi:EVE domain-containing protein [Microbacterium sp. STN6]|uniref:EVE domain-containing protein n=1 Tax=Microbacterium sp. STN6 TaxID=2995588 RepID=UPI002260D7F3|nr:EVE domain-containing protein [Microbacterium sp. STN6]MCX7523158.1 EVE domain-containing protein [Microbacterium sp. STN6]